MSPKQTPRVSQQPALTSSRGEKISAVEGQHLTPRMRALLEASKDKTGDERRELIRAQFSAQNA